MEVTNLHEATRNFPCSTDPSTNAELTPTPERSQTPQGFEHETIVDSELLESQLINEFFPEHTRKKTFNATVGDHKGIWEEMFRMANTPIMKNADINVLAAIIFIFNMQIRYNISDIGISAYFRFMGAFAIPPNERGKFPTNREEAVKTLKAVGLEMKTIHACRDDCILYYGPHEKLDTCPTCKKPRYRDDKIGNDIPVKVKHSSYVTCICTYTLQDICHCHKEFLCIMLRISICLLNILF